MKSILHFCLSLLLIVPFMAWGQSKLDVFYPNDAQSFGTYAVEFADNASIPESLQIKYRANGWTYILAERKELYELLAQGIITKLYREPAGVNVPLNDSMRTKHFVNEVHQGLDMDFAYKGKNVIMGYVDDGLDVRHLDFKDSLGNTRVLRFWNQGQSVNWRTPTKYGYGRVYKNTDIDATNTIVGNINQSGHGTTVTGVGSGNGLANGRNKGVAPDCNIIVVRTVFSLPSWTLTVAEGVDYIFSVADSLGMPAVVNLSVGTYLGSHDAKDPAGLYIDSLLNEKEGRIVVCAAGNSGAWPAYHVQQQLSADTNFVWMIPNPALTFGSPGVYFDLWADTNNIQNMHFAFGADAPGPLYRGNTTYKQVDFSNQTLQNETIYGIDNDIIGNVIFQGQVVGPNYNLQAIIYTDSLDYHIRFLATGAGKIDLWSSSNIGLSNFSSTIPDTTLHPEFTKYMMPDTLQSIVSSWACSHQVITVGNTHNRKNYIDSQGNVYPIGGGTTPAGILSINSSKGPNRQGNVKPDLVASGDMSLSAAVLGLPHPPSSLDLGGLHIRNGGTSMASPVVAGIAALYLEKCPKSTWADFKNDLIGAAFQDSFTGNNLPNYAYGYGKAHALNTLLQTEMNPQIQGNSILCSGQTELEVDVPNSDYVVWNTGDTTDLLQVTQTGSYHGLVTNNKGCQNLTDTLVVEEDTAPPLANAPSDTWISCTESIPTPDVNLVTDISDDCEIDAVVHLNDLLNTSACVHFVERTYRVTDESSNETDVTQIISILQGTEPITVANDETLVPVHACNGVFVHPSHCEQKVLAIDANGNVIDFDMANVSVHHEFVSPPPSGVSSIASGNSGYYETDDGLNTFRVSKKLFSIDAAGHFSNNGGAYVRLYYDADDVDGIVNDVPDFGVISNFGWFKSSHHEADDIVGEMSPAAPLLASATSIVPVNSGTENGILFVEFLVDSFSTFGYFSSTEMTPLPVTISKWTAYCSGDQIELHWQTSSEVNASHFTVESSRDGIHWQQIVWVAATGTSTQLNSYEALAASVSGVQYFRLNQFDLNGASTTYGPISVNCQNTNSHWSVFPNPSSSELQLQITCDKPIGASTIQVVDLGGKIVFQTGIDLVQGQNHKMVQVADLAQGVYTLRISNAALELLPLKIVVQRD